jgi:hypothetical protein
MNNFGSQATDIINLLHEQNNYIVYLSAQNNKKIEGVADIYLSDMTKSTDIEEYVTFLLEMCRVHNIDVFLPFRKMEELSVYKDRFNSIGVKLMVPSDTEMFRLLNDKAKTYDYLKEDIGDYIPEYYIVNNIEELKHAFNVLHEKNKVVCMKYVVDISANSFRIINFGERNVSELEVDSVASKNRIKKTLTEREVFELFKDGIPRTLLVMEYMEGREVSCDCLKLNSGKNLIIPRIKHSDKHQRIVMDETLLHLCNVILDKTGYDTICNIQFKYLKDKPLLLEVNTRMSGGVMIASWATGLNLPAIAVSNLCGEELNISTDIKSVDIVSKMVYEFTTVEGD